jgi:predicted lipoprotein with Yx(FWY)xxD motif
MPDQSSTPTRTGALAARWGALACGVVLALGGYGMAAPAASAKASADSTATVKVAKVAGVGTVLVDAQGKSLYTHTNGTTDAGCDATCIGAWPPLLVTAGTKATGAKGVKGLGVAADGQQVTLKGLPLYTFAGDSAPHTASGDGLDSFGGVWHVAKVKAAKKAKAKASSGYGY